MTTFSPAVAPTEVGPLTVLARATASELVKLRSVRSTGWVLLAAALSIVLIGVANAIGVLVTGGRPSGVEGGPAADPATAALSGVGAAIVVVAALGVLSVTADYASGMIRTTLAAVPRRAVLLLAKTLALVALTLPVLLGAVLLTALATRLIVAPAGLSLSLGQPGLVRGLVGAALYLTLLAVFTAGLGWLLRSTAGALTVWLALWLVPTFTVMLLPDSLAVRVGPWLPGNAGTAVYQVGAVTDAAGWASLGVFAAYAVVLMALATLVLQRRDA